MLAQMQQEYPWLPAICRGVAYKANAELDEVEGEAGLAIAKALPYYDPDKGDELDAWLRVCVRNHLHKFVYRTDRKQGVTGMGYEVVQRIKYEALSNVLVDHSLEEFDFLQAKAAQQKLKDIKPIYVERLMLWLEGYRFHEIAKKCNLSRRAVFVAVKKNFPHYKDVTYDQPALK